MIEQLKKQAAKILGVQETQAVVETPSEVVAEVIDEAKVQMSVDLAAAKDQIASLLSELNSVKAELQGFVEAKVKADREALEAKLEARKQELTSVVGTERVANVFEATKGLTDTEFEAVKLALSGAVVKEAESEMFSEIGVTAEAAADAVIDKDDDHAATVNLLVSKYQTK